MSKPEPRLPDPRRTAAPRREIDWQVFIVVLLLSIGCGLIVAGVVMIVGVGVALIVAGALALVGGWMLA